MADKRFLITEFHNGSVEVVPREWVNKKMKKVQWPRDLTNTKMEKAIRNSIIPNEDWETFSLTRILGASDSFGRAKKKADMAIYTSSISDSDDDGDGKRKRKIRRRLLTEDSSSEEERPSIVVPEEQSSRPCVPEFPSVECQAGKPVEVQGEREQQDDTAKVESSRLPGRDISLQILKSIEALKHEILLLRKQVSSLEQRSSSSSQSDEPGVARKTSFPVCGEEELASFNEELTNPAIMASVVKELSSVGGMNAQKLIANMLKKCLANSLAQKYSCCGRKGKKNFSSHLLFQAILRATKIAFTQATDLEVQAAVSKFLAGAKDREGGRQERRLSKIVQI
ncbi:uncharacterized protein LOC124173179 isoform X2 [Ischnura elegans]|uniref:uncharacterized protein LOC124173179 isoform X2 n=1 Tax=Ischnura elegans TaxID=197161 RepID=UPI001ED8983A|nr:uncharacterized protein LOC124173179 isoform X2 [Ischnura elegans]